MFYMCTLLFVASSKFILKAGWAVCVLFNLSLPLSCHLSTDQPTIHLNQRVRVHTHSFLSFLPEYPRRNQSNTKRRPLRHAPDALSKEGAASSVEEGVGQDGTSPETTAQNIDLKAGQMDMRSAPGTPGDSSESKKKHKKKRLAVAATAASGEEGERQVPSTTVKAKKSKKRDRRSM